jgi:hypothetical protein
MLLQPVVIMENMRSLNLMTPVLVSSPPEVCTTYIEVLLEPVLPPFTLIYCENRLITIIGSTIRGLILTLCSNAV